MSDPRGHTEDGPMCRRVMKAGGPDGKEGFVEKETRILTRSEEVAEVLRGDRLCTHKNRPCHMIWRSEIAAEYSSLVVADVSAFWRQVVSDGSVRVEEMVFCRTSARRR